MRKKHFLKTAVQICVYVHSSRRFRIKKFVTMWRFPYKTVAKFFVRNVIYKITTEGKMSKYLKSAPETVLTKHYGPRRTVYISLANFENKLDVQELISIIKWLLIY
jgi:hypothetical protein